MVLAALEMAGAWSTVSVNGCMKSGETPLLASTVKLKVYGPVPKFGGVPVKIPVVLPIDSQAGTVPVRLNVGFGLPVATTE